MNNPTLGQQVLITDTPLCGHIVALFDVDRHPYALVALEEGFYGFRDGQEVAYLTKLACRVDNLEPLTKDTLVATESAEDYLKQAATALGEDEVATQTPQQN